MLVMHFMNMKLLKISINNLTKKYGKKIVFEDFNLMIDNSRINFLISPNGVGKSTLIKCILKLTHYKGNITNDCQKVSYCPEKVTLPSFLRVREFLKLFDIKDEKIEYYLKMFKIDPKARISELSKGMHQKLIIIQTIAVDVDGYFFDEPLNGLDTTSEKILIEELRKLYKLNKLIVIASHYLEKFKILPHNIIELNHCEKVY